MRISSISNDRYCFNVHCCIFLVKNLSSKGRTFKNINNKKSKAYRILEWVNADVHVKNILMPLKVGFFLYNLILVHCLQSWGNFQELKKMASRYSYRNEDQSSFEYLSFFFFCQWKVDHKNPKWRKVWLKIRQHLTS